MRNDTHVGRRGQNNQDFFDRMRFKYRISVLDHGARIATDTPERIRSNDFVQKAYFGGGDN